MRDIEFRGKVSSEILQGNVKKDGTWVYGFYRDRVGCPTISEFDFNYCNYVDFEIDRNTLGQYTGLKDKNGTKIFEGDIIKLTDKSYPIKVMWLNEDARFNFYDLACGVNISMWDKLAEQCEVIGNIYDNPELLKGGEVCK